MSSGGLFSPPIGPTLRSDHDPYHAYDGIDASAPDLGPPHGASKPWRRNIGLDFKKPSLPRRETPLHAKGPTETLPFRHFTTATGRGWDEGNDTVYDEDDWSILSPGISRSERGFERSSYGRGGLSPSSDLPYSCGLNYSHGTSSRARLDPLSDSPPLPLGGRVPSTNRDYLSGRDYPRSLGFRADLEPLDNSAPADSLGLSSSLHLPYDRGFSGGSHPPPRPSSPGGCCCRGFKVHVVGPDGRCIDQDRLDMSRIIDTLNTSLYKCAIEDDWCIGNCGTRTRDVSGYCLSCEQRASADPKWGDLDPKLAARRRLEARFSPHGLAGSGAGETFGTYSRGRQL